MALVSLWSDNGKLINQIKIIPCIQNSENIRDLEQPPLWHHFPNLFHEVMNAPIQDVIKDQGEKYATPAANIVEYAEQVRNFDCPARISERTDWHPPGKQPTTIATEKKPQTQMGKVIYREFLPTTSKKRSFTLYWQSKQRDHPRLTPMVSLWWASKKQKKQNPNPFPFSNHQTI